MKLIGCFDPQVNSIYSVTSDLLIHVSAEDDINLDFCTRTRSVLIPKN